LLLTGDLIEKTGFTNNEDVYDRLKLSEIPWNSEKPPKELVQIITSGLINGNCVLDIGCGAGNYSIYLAKNGFSVTGIDKSPRAISIAQKRMLDEGVTCNFFVVDVLENFNRFQGLYDFIFDWQLLHHIYPEYRENYVRNIHRLLKRNSYYLSVCFNEGDTEFGGSGKYRDTPLGTRLYFSSKNELERKADILLIAAAPSTDAETDSILNKAWLKHKDGEVLRNAITGQMQTVAKLSQTLGLSISDIHEILDELTYDLELNFNQVIKLWHREFSYSFEEVTIDSLHVMMLDGRAVLSHTFGDESQVEPALVAGLFSAITSFAKEAVRSEQLLKTIDHGDVVLTIEYSKWVFAAIFADSTSTELRKILAEYLDEFEKKYSKILPKWLGDLDAFSGEIENIGTLFENL